MSLLLALQSGGTVHNVTVDEVASATDSQNGLAVFASALSESGTALDSEVGLADFAGVLAEAVAASESQTAPADFATAVDEILATLDSQTGTTPQVYDVSVDESLTIADAAYVEIPAPYEPSGTYITFAGLRRPFSVKCREELNAIDSQDATVVTAWEQDRQEEEEVALAFLMLD
jgi:hypothetical protein